MGLWFLIGIASVDMHEKKREPPKSASVTGLRRPTRETPRRTHIPRARPRHLPARLMFSQFAVERILGQTEYRVVRFTRPHRHIPPESKPCTLPLLPFHMMPQPHLRMQVPPLESLDCSAGPKSRARHMRGCHCGIRRHAWHRERGRKPADMHKRSSTLLTGEVFVPPPCDRPGASGGAGYHLLAREIIGN